MSDSGRPEPVLDTRLEIFDPAYFDRLGEGAAASPRLRQHGNIHATLEEPCQRLFIALHRDSYIPPHRHLLDPKRETLIAIAGLMAFLTFDEAGNVRDVTLFGSEAHGGGTRIPVGVDLPPTLWHAVVTLSPTATLFEAKQGPFVPALAKEPCPWAPAEGSPDAMAFLEAMRERAMDQVRLQGGFALA